MGELRPLQVLLVFLTTETSLQPLVVIYWDAEAFPMLGARILKYPLSLCLIDWNLNWRINTSSSNYSFSQKTWGHIGLHWLPNFDFMSIPFPCLVYLGCSFLTVLPHSVGCQGKHLRRGISIILQKVISIPMVAIWQLWKLQVVYDFWREDNLVREFVFNTSRLFSQSGGAHLTL